MLSNAIKADLYLLLVTFIAALGWVLSREALAAMTPLFFMGVRFTGAGLILALLGGNALMRLTRQDWYRGLLTGSVNALAMACWIMGLSLTENLGIGAFLNSLGVVFIPVVARLFFHASSTVSTWVAVVVALFGLVLLRVEGGFALAPSDVFFLLSALIFSVQFNLNSRFVKRIPALPLTAIQLFVTGVICTLLSWWLEPAPTRVGGSIVAIVLTSILFATCFRFWLQVKAQSLSTVGHAAVILTLEPIWTSLVGVWIYSEGMSALQVLGCMFIFCGLLISRWRVLFRRPLPVTG